MRDSICSARAAGCVESRVAAAALPRPLERYFARPGLDAPPGKHERRTAPGGVSAESLASLPARITSYNVCYTKLLRAEELSQKQEEENKKREKRASYIEDLTKNFDLIIGELMANVQSALEKMRTASSNMSKTADKTNSQATSVAAASEQATSNVETVAAAAEELV